jgi:NADPH:quinone reductase-like Zn-dependent oxidoreductase
MKAVRINRFGPPEVIVVEDIPKPSPRRDVHPSPVTSQ